MLYTLIAIAAGTSVVLARNINSILATKIGLLEGTLYNYCVGLFFSTIFLLFSSETFKLGLQNAGTIPAWAYLGGLVGVIVVVLSNLVTPKLSAFYLTLIIFIGQLFAGMLIDYFTLSILSKGKIIGGVLVVLGLTYNLFIDRKNS
jgi:transporter family-2 protein